MSTLKPMSIIQQRYRVIRSLGKGGFGETYEVESLETSEYDDKPHFALKQLHNKHQSSTDWINRFKKESAALELLGNKYDFIPTLHDYFKDGKNFYIVQELIIGDTLAVEVGDLKFWKQQKALDFLVEMAIILKAVHQEKIIHRDIKPANIIRRKNGKLVLIDFGIIKEITTDHPYLASTSIMVGTRGFAPFEQCQGRPCYNSDIYALGVTAILALTGKYPGELDERNGEIYWRDNCSVDDRLADIIDKMVCARSIARYSDAKTLLEALESFSKSSHLSPQYFKGKWGYKDEGGIFIIAPQFDWANSFSEGVAPVLVGDQYGYIDISGKFTIPPQFDWGGDFNQGLAQVRVNSKYGYIDTNGTSIIPCYFDAVENFSEGFALVRVNYRYGYINTSGAYILSPQLRWGGDFNQGLAWISMNGNCKYGYIDTTGNYVIPPQFDWGGDFNQGLAQVRVNSKYGYIDTTGNYVIPPQFDRAKDFCQGLAQVHINHKCRYIDTTGNYVIPSCIPSYFNSGSENFFQGLAKMNIDDKWGYIDTTGRFIINPQFDDAGDFFSGLAKVNIDDKWGYIDTTGRFIIDPQFDNAGDFFNGLAPIMIYQRYETGIVDGKHICRKFDHNKKNAGDSTVTFDKPKWGYIDTNGVIIINPVFYKAGNFFDELALVVDDHDDRYYYINSAGKRKNSLNFDCAGDFSNGLAPVMVNKKFGFINISGDYIVTPNFDYIGNFSNGFAPVSINNKWGCINIDGEISILLEFDEITYFSEDGLARIKVGRKYGYININGDYITSLKFDDASDFNEGLALVKVGQKYGYIDVNGNYIVSPQYISAPDLFTEGLALVRIDNIQLVYIDRSGKVVK